MSSWGWLDGYAHVFNVHGSSKSGQLWYANVDYSTAEVVRLSNFSLIKFFHNNML